MIAFDSHSLRSPSENAGTLPFGLIGQKFGRLVFALAHIDVDEFDRRIQVTRDRAGFRGLSVSK